MRAVQEQVVLRTNSSGAKGRELHLDVARMRRWHPTAEQIGSVERNDRNKAVK